MSQNQTPKTAAATDPRVGLKAGVRLHFAEKPYGFEYGAAIVTRLFSDVEKGWVTLGLETPKHSGNKGLQIYITKTGKVRIHDSRGEWTPPVI